MSETEDNEITIKETIEEVLEDMSVAPIKEDTLDKNIEKPKKPRTEAQKNALRKAQEARKLKSLKKKELDRDYMEDSEYFKKLTPQQRKHLKEMAIEEAIPHKSSVPRGKKEKVVYESDPESDEEVIVYKKKKPKKKTKKKVIYESASDSSEEDEPIVKQIQKPKIKKVVIEDPVEFSDEEPFTDDNSYYQYQHQPLTYSSVARFL